MRKPEHEHQVTLEFHFMGEDSLVIEGVTNWKYCAEHEGYHPAEWMVHEWIDDAVTRTPRTRHHKVQAFGVQYITVTIHNPPSRVNGKQIDHDTVPPD
jgi:hypothetical protein